MKLPKKNVNKDSKFVDFLGYEMTRLFAFEIYWPLESPSATYELLWENKTDKKLMKMQRFAVSDLVPAILWYCLRACFV